jgi:hypothetical protein
MKLRKNERIEGETWREKWESCSSSYEVKGEKKMVLKRTRVSSPEIMYNPGSPPYLVRQANNILFPHADPTRPLLSFAVATISSRSCAAV